MPDPREPRADHAAAERERRMQADLRQQRRLALKLAGLVGASLAVPWLIRRWPALRPSVIGALLGVVALFVAYHLGHFIHGQLGYPWTGGMPPERYRRWRTLARVARGLGAQVESDAVERARVEHEGRQVSLEAGRGGLNLALATTFSAHDMQIGDTGRIALAPGCRFGGTDGAHALYERRLSSAQRLALLDLLRESPGASLELRRGELRLRGYGLPLFAARPRERIALLHDVLCALEADASTDVAPPEPSATA